MTQLFKCPKCGYKNYVTREDLDAARVRAGDRAARNLADKERGKPLMRSVAEGLRRFFSPPT